jgi:hypothetical protein
MASYTTCLEVLFTEIFYCAGSFCVAIEIKSRWEFSVRVASLRDTVYQIVKQFQETGRLRDKRATAHRPSTSVLMVEVVGAAREAVTRNPTINFRRLDQQIGASTSTAWEICLDDLSLFPYWMCLSQPLSKDRIAKRYALAKEYEALMKENPGVLNVTWLNDETHFYLHVYTNKQNFQFWVSENPKVTVANPPGPEGVWEFEYFIRVVQWYSLSWCLPQSAEGCICSFPKVIWHSIELSLVSSRWCQFQNQQCRTSLLSRRFRGNSHVDPASCVIWGRIFMATNLTGLKLLR